MDEYEDDLGRPARDKHTIMYGQVQFYAYITLQANLRLGLTRDMTAILAVVSLCRTNGEDATQGPVWYKEGDVESLRVFSARAIDCPVGRVKIGNRWGIVDWCWGLQEAIMEGMVDPEYESEDDPNI